MRATIVHQLLTDNCCYRVPSAFSVGPRISARRMTAVDGRDPIPKTGFRGLNALVSESTRAAASAENFMVKHAVEKVQVVQ